MLKIPLEKLHFLLHSLVYLINQNILDIKIIPKSNSFFGVILIKSNDILKVYLIDLFIVKEIASSCIARVKVQDDWHLEWNNPHCFTINNEFYNTRFLLKSFFISPPVINKTRFHSSYINYINELIDTYDIIQQLDILIKGWRSSSTIIGILDEYKSPLLELKQKTKEHMIFLELNYSCKIKSD